MDPIRVLCVEDHRLVREAIALLINGQPDMQVVATSATAEESLTLFRALRREWFRHRRISAWTFPLWLYVSVTGVVIYWMLYHVAPGLVK